MSTFRMDNGTVVNTEKSSQRWNEKRDSDGKNLIGRSSRSQWHDDTLYRSRKGRYYLVHGSSVQGQRDYAEWVSDHEAARWLILNGYDLPEGLQAIRDEIEE